MPLAKIVKMTFNSTSGKWSMGLPIRFNSFVKPGGYVCVSEGKDGTIILTPKNTEGK